MTTAVSVRKAQKLLLAIFFFSAAPPLFGFFGQIITCSGFFI